MFHIFGPALVQIMHFLLVDEWIEYLRIRTLRKKYFILSATQL